MNIEKYKELTKLPISVEVMALEYELENELAKPDRDTATVNYLFSRCNKLWNKLKSKELESARSKNQH